jgi:hypothetical protein
MKIKQIYAPASLREAAAVGVAFAFALDGGDRCGAGAGVGVFDMMVKLMSGVS